MQESLVVTSAYARRARMYPLAEGEGENAIFS